MTALKALADTQNSGSFGTQHKDNWKYLTKQFTKSWQQRIWMNEPRTSGYHANKELNKEYWYLKVIWLAKGSAKFGTPYIVNGWNSFLIVVFTLILTFIKDKLYCLPGHTALKILRYLSWWFIIIQMLSVRATVLSTSMKPPQNKQPYQTFADDHTLFLKHFLHVLLAFVHLKQFSAIISSPHTMEFSFLGFTPQTFVILLFFLWLKVFGTKDSVKHFFSDPLYHQ
jgi:hypothetical protein